MREVIIELSNHFGVNVEEITTGTNDYPENLQPVLTDFESIDHLKAVREELESTGHKCIEIEMHKKNGWSLWNYVRYESFPGMYRKAKDRDWTFDIDTNKKRKAQRNHVKVTLFGDRPENPSEAKEISDSIVSELPENVGTVTVFYDPDNGYAFERWASDQTTGYYEDTNHYKIALLIESAPDQEEE